MQKEGYVKAHVHKQALEKIVTLQRDIEHLEMTNRMKDAIIANKLLIVENNTTVI